MNQRIKQLIAVAFLATTAGLEAKSLNHAALKSFGNNVSRELVNLTKAWKNQDAADSWFGNVGVTGQYNQSFRNNKPNGLGSLISFGGSTTNVMTVGGGNHATNEHNLDGYQLGLGNLTSPTRKMQLDPKLYQAGADFQIFVGANKYEAGFYFKAKGAIGVASIDPQLTESGSLGTQAAYGNGIFGSGVSYTVSDLNTNLAEAFAGTKDIKTYYKKLANGLIAGKQTTGAQFGDVELALGYNFVANDNYTVGIGVRGSLPTASKKPTGTYALEPIFGRGGHWGLGGETLVRANVYNSEDGEKSLNFWLHGYAQHLFKAKQKRSFDTEINGEGSRYLLVAKYNPVAIVTTSAESVTGFQNEVGNLINYSTLACNVTSDVEGAVAAMFDYNCCNWNMGIGAEFWGASKEKISITDTMTSVTILGRQHQNNGAHLLGYSQPNATMTSQITSHNNPDDASGDRTFAGLASSQITHVNLDARSAANDARYSGKIFGNVGYAWTDSKYCPHLSVTSEAEFGASERNTVSQWGVAVQGGICF